MRTDNSGLWPSNGGAVFVNPIAGRGRSREADLSGVSWL